MAKTGNNLKDLKFLLATLALFNGSEALASGMTDSMIEGMNSKISKFKKDKGVDNHRNMTASTYDSDFESDDEPAGYTIVSPTDKLEQLIVEQQNLNVQQQKPDLYNLPSVNDHIKSLDREIRSARDSLGVSNVAAIMKDRRAFMSDSGIFEKGDPKKEEVDIDSIKEKISLLEAEKEDWLQIPKTMIQAKITELQNQLNNKERAGLKEQIEKWEIDLTYVQINELRASGNNDNNCLEKIAQLEGSLKPRSTHNPDDSKVPSFTELRKLVESNINRTKPTKDIKVGKLNDKFGDEFRHLESNLSFNATNNPSIYTDNLRGGVENEVKVANNQKPGFAPPPAPPAPPVNPGGYGTALSSVQVKKPEENGAVSLELNASPKFNLEIGDKWTSEGMEFEVINSRPALPIGLNDMPAGQDIKENIQPVLPYNPVIQEVKILRPEPLQLVEISTPINSNNARAEVPLKANNVDVTISPKNNFSNNPKNPDITPRAAAARLQREQQEHYENNLKRFEKIMQDNEVKAPVVSEKSSNEFLDLAGDQDKIKNYLANGLKLDFNSEAARVAKEQAEQENRNALRPQFNNVMAEPNNRYEARWKGDGVVPAEVAAAQDDDEEIRFGAAKFHRDNLDFKSVMEQLQDNVKTKAETEAQLRFDDEQVNREALRPQFNDVVSELNNKITAEAELRFEDAKFHRNNLDFKSVMEQLQDNVKAKAETEAQLRFDGEQVNREALRLRFNNVMAELNNKAIGEGDGHEGGFKGIPGNPANIMVPDDINNKAAGNRNVQLERSINMLNQPAGIIPEDKLFTIYTAMSSEMTKDNSALKEYHNDIIETVKAKGRNSQEVEDKIRLMGEAKQVFAVSALNKDIIAANTAKGDLEQNMLLHVARIAAIKEKTPEIIAKSLEREKSTTTAVERSILAGSHNLVREAVGTHLSAVGIAAGDDEKHIIKSVWVKGLYGSSKQSRYKSGSSYGGYNGGGIFGIDFATGNSAIVGLSYGYVSSDFRYKAERSGDKVEARSNVFSIYGQRDLDNNFILQGILSYVDSDLKLKNYRPLVDRFAQAKTKGKSYSADATLSYKYDTGNNIILLPNIGLQYAHHKTKAYTESDADIENKRVSGAANSITTGSLGLKAMLPQTISNGMLITPMLYASIENDLNSQTKKAKAQFVNMPDYYNSTVATDAKQPKPGFNTGAGLIGKYNDLEISLNYNLHIKKKYQDHQGSLKLKVLF